MNEQSVFSAVDTSQAISPPDKAITSRSTVPWLLVAAIIALFVPVYYEAATLWLSDDAYSHCIFILPISLGLLWMQREAIRQAPLQPTAWGLLPLTLGLLLETVGYLFRIKSVAALALVPVVTGAILLLHGRALWKIARFSVYFLLCAVPLPGVLLSAPSAWIQRASSTGAATLMSALGYPLTQTGNIIEIPGLTLEVADVCSGFKKLTACVAFALLYGYFFPLSRTKRVLLVLASIPIALLANIIRVSGLVAVATAGGKPAVNIAHDWAEIFVLVVAFGLFVLLGKILGCKTPRF
jgi:exosortase